MLDLRAPEFRADPYPTLARLRREAPVYRDDFGIWYLTRYADVQALTRDPRLGRDLRKWQGYALLRPYLADSPLEQCVERWMFSLDPPDHTRLRKLVLKTFTPSAVAALRNEIVTLTDDLLDRIEANHPERGFDLVEAFAQPLPVQVIARILGLPLERDADLSAWSEAIALVLEPTSGRKKRALANDAAIAMMQHLRERIAEQRGTTGPGLLRELVAVEADGDRLSEEELVAQLVLLFIAGHETTRNVIGMGVLAMLRNPSELARLRSHPELMPSAVEEMLRYDPPGNTNARVAHEDIEVGGHTIRAGEITLSMVGAANRDPEIFPDPDRFDIGRAPNPHLSFGGGVHFCLGAPLARLEVQVAIERLLQRFSTLELDESSVRWRDLVNVRGLETLRIAASR